MKYDRLLAKNYAERYALSRNKNFFDFSRLGGDCTNFVSQCLFAGTGQMDYRENGWFYKDLDERTPSWTGVNELSQYLLENNRNIVCAYLTRYDDVEIGDVIQLKMGNIFNHSLFVTKTDYPILSFDDIFVSCHSTDKLNARLSSFLFKDIKFLKVY